MRRQSFDRSGLEEVPMSLRMPAAPAEGWNIVEIQVQGSSGRRVPGSTVALVDLAGRKRYTASTAADGIARFHLPGGRPYDIDVEEHLNAAHLLMEDRIDHTLGQTVIYDAYDIIEKRRNDTILQAFKMPLQQKASRALYRIRVQKNGKAWTKGTVLLDATGSRDVYTARTDSSGTAVFILPFGKRYLVHFPFQRDVDVINLLDARQEAHGSAELEYRPDPALEFPERFLPTPDRLTLTHFRYYHKTPYPPAPGPRPSLIAQSTASAREGVLHFGIGGNPASVPQRRPLNAAFVLDISASMAGNDRIESLKRGLLQLLTQLRANDRIAIITFDDRKRLLLPSQLAGNDRSRIMDIIRTIQPDGGTNMLEALRSGYGQVAQHRNAAYDNRVILLSDGFDSNPTDTLLAAQRPWRELIPCMAIGVGRDYNSELLHKLSNHAFLQQAHEGPELERFFRERLLHATPIATEISVELRFDEALTCNKVYGLDTQWRSGNTIKGRLPALYTGNDLPCLASFQPKAGATKKETYAVTVTTSYRNQITGSTEQQEQQLQLRLEQVLPVTGALSEPDKMYRVAQLNDCLLRMATHVEKQQYREAQKANQEGLLVFSGNTGLEKDEDLNVLYRQLRRYETALRNTLKNAATAK
jgi:uncharacterized protein YegL